MNRVVFGFNNVLDKAVLTPAAKGYRAVTPEPARDGVRNFFSNLRSPIILINDLLQGEWKRAGQTISRFTVNTTIGLGGLFDVAKRHGIEKHNEDFGQTMARVGITPGPYLVLPFFGPSNFRDALGRLPDTYFSATQYTRFEGKNTFTTTRRVLTTVDQRSRALDTIERLRENSFDEYAGARDLYQQTRKNAVANGIFEVENLPEFDISGE